MTQVSRGTHTRERIEVMDQVRLIKVTAGNRNVGPVDLLCGVHRLEDMVETHDALKPFRRHADLMAEETNEATRAKAAFIDHVCNRHRMGRPLKLHNGVLDGRMGLTRRSKAFEQEPFEDSEPRLAPVFRKQLITQIVRRLADKQVERNNEIFQSPRRRREENKPLSRLEASGDHRDGF
jgi:hypothetical protein